MDGHLIEERWPKTTGQSNREWGKELLSRSSRMTRPRRRWRLNGGPLTCQWSLQSILLISFAGHRSFAWKKKKMSRSLKLGRLLTVHYLGEKWWAQGVCLDSTQLNWVSPSPFISSFSWLKRLIKAENDQSVQCSDKYVKMSSSFIFFLPPPQPQ